jgi:uncharacterized protein (TIGR02001 family)
MKHLLSIAAVLLAAAGAAPAWAQEPPKPFTVTGSVGLVSDYRFRGVSQSDKGFAVQGALTITHQSGLYVGTFASNLAGWGTFGGPNLEVDVIGGYKLPLGGGLTLDGGLTWYMYPGGADKTDFAEPYLKLSGTAGPVSWLGGVAYAPKQQALGRWYASGADAQAGVYTDPGDKEDNLYVWGDVSAAVPGTGLTAKGHIGYSDGNKGLGPNGTSIAPTGRYADWMLGADYVLGPVTLGVAYVDTDITSKDAAYLRPNFATVKGHSISGATAVFSITAAF